MRLNFDSPEWPVKRDELMVKLLKLGEALNNEHDLTQRRKFYATNEYRVYLCSGAHADTDGKAHLGCPVQLPTEQANALAVMTLDDLIGQRRDAIAKLLDEFA